SSSPTISPLSYTTLFRSYIEVGHAHAKKVPANYQRRQTLKGAERYVTAELKAHEEQVLTAEEQLRQREQELFLALRERVGASAVDRKSTRLNSSHLPTSY